MPSQKLSVYTIKTSNGVTWYDIVEKLLSNSSDQERCIINEQADFYIGGCYLLETIHNQTQYNVEEGKFEIVPVKRLNILKFDVFAQNQTLLLWGGKKVASAFLTAIERASNRQIVLDYKDSDFRKMVEYLVSNPEISFSRMRITDIVIDHGILANCSVNLRGQENERVLVKRYLDNISQLSVMIGSDELAVSMTIFSTGAVIVYRDRDDIPNEAMNFINDMFGGVM